MHSTLDSLTPAQREAVCHVEGPLLVLAGPGSGKTRVITHRITHLIEQGTPPQSILALTFTNKAADEMRTRVQALAPGAAVWLGTFHRFCARLLRRYAQFAGLQDNYTIYDTDDSARVLRRAIAGLNLDLTHTTPDAVAAAIRWAKNNLILPDEYRPRPGNPLGGIVKRVYEAYQRHLAAANAADFDDLLLHVATLLRENPDVRAGLDEQYQFVLVDEYQDTNLAQYAIARALCIDHPNLAATGDPDQSIYGWRGANLNNILEFERDFPSVRVVRLERNYRSTKRILRVAADLIAHNVKRKQKDLYTENEAGRPVRLVTYATHHDEARDIAARIVAEVASGRRRWRDFAVFYRINALSRALESALREHGAPYQLVHGLEFFQRKEIRDVLAYLRLIANPRDDEAFLRAVNAPPRGIGKTTVDRITRHASRGGLSVLEAARQAPRIESLGKRPAGLVARFVELLDRLATLAAAPVEETVGRVLAETGYRGQFDDAENEEEQQRLANLEELLTACREFDERCAGPAPLEEFLEEASLTGDTDDWEADRDRVTLMTLHASKGLEFPAVFLVAVEQGLLPHERSRNDPDQLEEERRLMFVGLTRAQEELQVSLARYRDFRGQRKMTVPSEFLMELPRAEMEVVEVGGGGPMDATGLEPDFDQGYSEPVFMHEETAEGPIPASRVTAPAPLTTAAELACGGGLDPVSPDEFCHGMVVRHPEYGLGRVVALSGSGDHRQATVDFASAAGRVRLVLAQSPLRPVRKQGH